MTKMKLIPINWIRDPLTEADLDRLGLPWEFQEGVSYRAIDVAGGRYNKARRGVQLREDLYVEYALRMESGDPMKATTLYMLDDGVHLHGVAHGNHRLRSYGFAHNDDLVFLASEAAILSAYVIKRTYCPEIEEFQRLANRREGWRQDTDEAKENAVWLVKERKRPIVEAARATGVKEKVISEAIHAEEMREKLGQMGIPQDNLTRGHVVRMHALKHDSHLRNVAQLANDAKLGTEDVSKLVARVNRTRSETAGNQVIFEEQQRTHKEVVQNGDGKAADREGKKRRKFLKNFRTWEDLWLRGNEGQAIRSLSDVGIPPRDRETREELTARWMDIERVARNALRIKKGA